MTNSPCLKVRTNDCLYGIDLSNSYPNSLANWMWKAFFEQVTNCTKRQNPKVKFMYHSEHFAKWYLAYSKTLESIYLTMLCLVS